ncbi:Lef-4 [Phenacoccus solenopsis nudivirus]|nr:Lef-4 [Phenacoccus solenopsis nudivirus]
MAECSFNVASVSDTTSLECRIDERLRYEYESTFRVKIPEDKYTQLLTRIEKRYNDIHYNRKLENTFKSSSSSSSTPTNDDGNNNDDKYYEGFDDEKFEYCTNVLLVFNNGCRLSERRYERKETTLRQFSATFFDFFYPMIRTQSTEQLMPPCDPADIGLITKCAYRYILTPTTRYTRHVLQQFAHTYNLDLANVNAYVDMLKFRLTLDNENTSTSNFYYLSCEVEYEKNSDIGEIYLFEILLIRVFYEFINETELKSFIKYEELTSTELFESIKPKVHLYSKFDQKQSYMWAPKWNGVSAKFIKIGKLISIWPDLSPLQTLEINDMDPAFDCLDKYSLQVELLDNLIVIVHVISIKVGGKLHYVDLYNNLSFLRHTHSILHNKRLGNYIVKVQQYTNSRLPYTFDMKNGLFDGLIIYQNNHYIKWKQPTIDAIYLGGNRFYVGSSKRYETLICPHLKEDEQNELQVGSLYELSATLEILRERRDRVYCATWEEYLDFVKNVKLLQICTDR